ncbi:MAG: RHS repeat domain-containing protein, partial [Thermoguttaceae bacterium]
QFDGTKTQLTANDLTHRYFWGAKQDELLCDNANWALGDHLNTVRDVVKNDGSVAAHLEYNAFGKLLTKLESAETILAYTGKLTDTTTGLQWNINRWYDASVGKWASEDPIGFRGRDNNLFRYVISNPIRYNDSSGLIRKCSDKNDIGNRWGSTSVIYSNGERDARTTFALMGTSPGDFDNAFNISIFLAAFATAYGVTEPRLTLADILTSEDYVPTSASVAALLMKLKKQMMDTYLFEVFIEYKCIECKCRTLAQRFTGIEENPNWQLAEKKWATCDLSKTSTPNTEGGLALGDIKDASDLANIESQCRNQLSAQVDGLCEK